LEDGNEAFTWEYLVQHRRELLAELGVRGTYSGHSFRRGAATSAKAAGVPDTEIQLLGRWTSNAYQTYIDFHPEQIFQIAHRFQNQCFHRSRSGPVCVEIKSEGKNECAELYEVHRTEKEKAYI
jgi:hypothetical protein